MTEKRFKMIITNADGSFHYLDEITGEKITSTLALEDKLNELNKENEQLRKDLKIIEENRKQETEYTARLEEKNEQLKSDIKLIEERADKVYDEKEQLKQFISKIDFAIFRKYDNSLENLLDEVYDGEYENWIKKQVSRAKKLDGDFE